MSGKFKPEEVSSSLWALCTLDAIDTATAKVLCNRASEEIKQYGPQSLANTAWAVAKAEVSMPDFFTEVGDIAVARLTATSAALTRRFNEQELSNLAWAFAKAGVEHEQLFDCLLYTSPSPRDATLSRMPSSA